MQIYFHSCLCSYLSRVPILVEGTVYLFFLFFLAPLPSTSQSSDVLLVSYSWDETHDALFNIGTVWTPDNWWVIIQFEIYCEVCISS